MEKDTVTENIKRFFFLSPPFEEKHIEIICLCVMSGLKVRLIINCRKKCKMAANVPPWDNISHWEQIFHFLDTLRMKVKRIYP